MTGKAVPRHERKLEAPVEFVFNENRGALVTLICVFVVHSSVVLLGVSAALKHYRHQWAKLL